MKRSPGIDLVLLAVAAAVAGSSSCIQAHCNLVEECPCADNTCGLAGCNIGAPTCADACQSHGGVAPPDAGLGACGPPPCLSDSVPSAFEGFFHLQDADSGALMNFRLFDGGSGFELTTNCPAEVSGPLGWCSPDAGIVDMGTNGEPFAPGATGNWSPTSGGSLRDPSGRVWSPGAACFADAGCAVVVSCPVPSGWDAGM